MTRGENASRTDSKDQRLALRKRHEEEIDKKYLLNVAKEQHEFTEKGLLLIARTKEI